MVLLNGCVMVLRGKFGFWLVLIASAVVVSLFVLPLASPVSWKDSISNWASDYQEAVESAQDDNDDDDDVDEDSVAGHMQVHISDEIADYAGVELLTLVETSFFPEEIALAKVVDLRPMLTVRGRYNKAKARLNVAKVSERSAGQELARLTSLAKGAGSVATKNVNYAQASLNEAKAESLALNVDVQAIGEEALQTWGGQVTTWILADNSKAWQRLLSHQDSLLLVTLPADLSLSAEVSFVRIARDGDRDHARKAYYVSPALATDQVIQGETYFFKTATGKLRSGMRLDVWLPQGLEPLSGVFIPEQAIVWSTGQAWVYVEVDDDLYQRRSIQSALPAAGGVFMQAEFNAGERLVIGGAQMLLSEEFRWQILDEDDD